jgi:hypothetical protein
VKTLRRFRDKYLLTNSFGTVLVNTYYRYSPPIAQYIGEHEALRTFARISLVPIVYSIAYPLFSILLFGTLVMIVVYRRKRRIRGNLNGRLIVKG